MYEMSWVDTDFSSTLGENITLETHRYFFRESESRFGFSDIRKPQTILPFCSRELNGRWCHRQLKDRAKYVLWLFHYPWMSGSLEERFPLSLTFVCRLKSISWFWTNDVWIESASHNFPQELWNGSRDWTKAGNCLHYLCQVLTFPRKGKHKQS